jgi:hypothetical protein
MPDEPAGLSCVFALGFLGSCIAGMFHSAWWWIVSATALYASIAQRERNRPTFEAIGEQLRQRPAFPGDAWGDGQRAALAELAGRVIAEEIGWPNHHFLPSDPVQIVFYCPCGDGGEGLAIFYELEQATERRWRFPDCATYGELIDRNVPGTDVGANSPIDAVVKGTG